MQQRGMKQKGTSPSCWVLTPSSPKRFPTIAETICCSHRGEAIIHKPLHRQCSCFPPAHGDGSMPMAPWGKAPAGAESAGRCWGQSRGCQVGFHRLGAQGALISGLLWMPYCNKLQYFVLCLLLLLIACKTQPHSSHAGELPCWKGWSGSLVPPSLYTRGPFCLYPAPAHSGVGRVWLSVPVTFGARL